MNTSYSNKILRRDIIKLLKRFLSKLDNDLDKDGNHEFLSIEEYENIKFHLFNGIYNLERDYEKLKRKM